LLIYKRRLLDLVDTIYSVVSKRQFWESAKALHFFTEYCYGPFKDAAARHIAEGTPKKHAGAALACSTSVRKTVSY
jgi:hypothetical protein